MKKYFTNLNEEYDIMQALIDIKCDLEVKLPYVDSGNAPMGNVNSNYSDAASYFLRMMMYLERLYFADDLEHIHSYTRCVYKNNHAFTTRIETAKNNPAYKSGFIMCEATSTQYPEEPPEAKHLPVLEEQFRDSHQFLKIFTVNNILCVYTNKHLSLEKILKLKLLQWSLTKDKITTPQPDIEIFINAFLNLEKTKMNKCIDNLFNCKEIIDLKYKTLEKMLKPNYQRAINLKANEKSRIENDIQYMENQIAELASKIRNLQTEIITMETLAQKETDNSALIKFIANHPYIKDFEQTGETLIDFYYEAPIVYFDTYLIDKIYHNYPTSKQKILKAFKDNKYELMVKCKIQFNTQTFQITPKRVNLNNDGFFGHPHINRHSCLGSHRETMKDAAKIGDYFAAIEQITQAVLNLNFADSVVIGTMLKELIDYQSLKTWRSKETGALLTTEEIMEIYHEET